MKADAAPERAEGHCATQRRQDRPLDAGPAGVPTPPAGAFSRVWTPERDAIVRRMWEAGERREAILAALLDTPGLAVSSPIAVKERANALGVSRPAGWAAMSARNLNASRTPWTPERIEYLRAAYTRGDNADDILAALNAMPADYAVTIKSLGSYAQKHRILRPADFSALAISRRKSAAGPWNAARDAKLRELYPQKHVPIARVLGAVNAIPGNREIRSNNAVYSRADKLGIPKRPQGPVPIPVQIRPHGPSHFRPAMGAEQTANLNHPPTYEAKIRKCIEMLAKGKEPIGIVGATGLQLHRVLMVKGYLRMGLPVL